MEEKDTNKYDWINPIGGLGDVLILSGVLKKVHDEFPDKKFNLARRTRYLSLLEGHPAIEEVGHPPKGSTMHTNDYWSKEPLGGGTQRPFQILSRYFGLKTPIEEDLYVPGGIEEDDFLYDFIPKKDKMVIIAPASDSPRKMIHPMGWHMLAEKLSGHNIQVVQVGKQKDLYIKGTYSVLGNTTPRQLISLVSKCDLVVTTDNFVMHAAHLVNKPAVVMWGPTKSEVYGYYQHTHLNADLSRCDLRDKCLGPDFPENYATNCPLNEEHCMNTINPDDIYKSVLNLL